MRIYIQEERGETIQQLLVNFTQGLWLQLRGRGVPLGFKLSYNEHGWVSSRKNTWGIREMQNFGCVPYCAILIHDQQSSVVEVGA